MKGRPPQTVEMKFSRHGPVFYMDRPRHRAYALRSALMSPGPVRISPGCVSRRPGLPPVPDAAMFWKSPSENLICGDVDGNISWQASALTPSRQGWSGRLPVPGSGAFEWQGFRKDLPREINPARGFIATANQQHSTEGLHAAAHVQVRGLALRADHATVADDPARKEADARGSRADAARRLLAARGSGPRGSKAGPPPTRTSNAHEGCSRIGTACTRRDSAAAAMYASCAYRSPRGARTKARSQVRWSRR